MAEVLWGDDLPGSWEQMVRGTMSSLRSLLRRCELPGDLLTTAHGCHQLRLPPELTVDVEEASAHLAAAESRLAAGDGLAARREAEAAVAVASRQFAPGTTGRWAERRQAELREVHLRSLEALAESAEENGQLGAAVDAAEQVLAIEPFRESAYLRLMSAHARAGHRGEALRAYDRCRKALADDLGVRPAPPTEAAYLALVGAEPAASDASSVPGQVPLPAAVAASPGAFLVGRDDPLARLAAALDRAAGGKRQAVFVAGEPGVGKTALVSEFARQAQAAGARVVYGRCDEEVGVAYQPFAEALGHLVAHSSVADLSAHVAAYGGELVRLVPQLSRRLDDVPTPLTTDPEADRFRLFGAVGGLLASAGGRGAPLVLIVDDLHWAAHATVLLLRHVLRAAEPAPLLVVTTYRQTDVGPDHPLAAALADLRRGPAGAERIELGGLDQSGVASFVEATWDRSLGPEEAAVARAVHAHTAGNPFFVGELLRHLAESGDVYRRDGHWSYYEDADGRGIPEGVREVVARRLQRLGGEANRSLVLAAVIGTEFDLDLLEAVSDGSDVPGVLDALDAAVSGRLVVEVDHGRFRFSHALVRETIHAGLSATRRGRLHLRVGEAIEALAAPDDPGRLPALAHHFAEAAKAGAALKAADYALAAARQANADAAWEDAAAFLDRGLAALDAQVPPDVDRRCDLLLLLAETWIRFYNTARARPAATAALDAARVVGDPVRIGEATYWLIRSPGNPYGPPGTEACNAASEAIVGLGEANPGLRAKLATAFTSDEADAQERCLRDALALARCSGDSEALGVVLARYCALLRGSPRLSDYLALADELVSAAPPDGWDGWRNGYWFRRFGRLCGGDRRGFEADMASCARYGAERRFWYFRWIARLWRGSLALLDGRFAEVERLAAEAHEIAETGVMSHDIYTRQLYRLELDRGELWKARDAATRLDHESPDHPIHQAMLAFVEAEVEGVDSDRHRFKTVADDGFGGMTPERWPVTLAFRSEIAVMLAGEERAAGLYETFLPYRDQIVVGGMSEGCMGAVDRYLGMLAAQQRRWDLAEAHYDTALALETGLRSLPLTARTRCWYGRMLLARRQPGDAERAVRLLDASGDTARQLGMGGLAADIRAVYARSTAPP